MLILKSPWTRQPTFAASVDWSNPLTRGLVFASIGGNGINVVYNTPPAGTATRAIGSYGIADARPTLYANDTRLNPTSELSVFVRSKNVGGGGTNFPTLLGKYAYSTESSNSGYFLDLRSNSEGRVGSFAVFNNNAAATYKLASSTAFNVANQEFSLCGTASGSGRALYVNGLLENTAAAATFRSSTNGVKLGQTSGGETRNFVSLIWLRELSGNEVKSLHDNPWQLFKPRLIYIPSPTAAAPVPTLSASTYVAGSLTSTGWRPQITAT